MKLTMDELKALHACVTCDANKRIYVHNFSQVGCGAYCSGMCCNGATTKGG